MKRELAELTVIKTGPGTSIQDLGRIGFTGFGIPVSGAMDAFAMKWVNYLLGNSENAAVIETLQPGLKLQFNSPTKICIGGALAKIKLNENLISLDKVIPIEFGDILEIGTQTLGAINYIGIDGGFQTDEILGSRSFYQGITSISQLSKGNTLSYYKGKSSSISKGAKVKISRDYLEDEVLEVYKGPEWKFLGSESKEALNSSTFTLSKLLNRMAFQIEELVPNLLQEMATAPVYPGTVQLTSGGKLIVLMKDAQVTGGYPRVLQLPEKSISQLSQKRAGSKFRFKIK